MTERRPTPMPPHVPLPEPIVELLEAHPSFLRGLTLGMLVGAAIAGSTIWERIRARPGSTEDAGSARAEVDEPSEPDRSETPAGS